MIVPVKFGIKTNPPTLIFVYKMWGKLRMRCMPIRNLWPTTSTAFILEDIRARHDILLGIPDETIIRMIDVLKSVKNGLELDVALAQTQNRGEEKLDENHNDSVSVEKLLNGKKVADDIVEETKSKQSQVNDEKKREKPYSFMDKKENDEDTDFELNDELPLDELDANSDDDFWR